MERQREGRTAQATCVQPLAVFPTGKNLTVEKDRVPKNWSQIKRAGTEVRQELLQHWLYHGSKHYDVDRYGQHLHTAIKTLSRLTACQDHVPQDRLPTIATHAIPRARPGTASSIPNNIARHWGRWIRPPRGFRRRSPIGQRSRGDRTSRANSRGIGDRDGSITNARCGRRGVGHALRRRLRGLLFLELSDARSELGDLLVPVLNLLLRRLQVLQVSKET